MRDVDMRFVIWLSHVEWQVSCLNLSELPEGWFNHRLAIAKYVARYKRERKHLELTNVDERREREERMFCRLMYQYRTPRVSRFVPTEPASSN